MFPRWWRLGIRPQLTIIVIFGAILSTGATLLIADSAIQNYVHDQAVTQQKENMRIANLVLTTQYGPNVSISSPNTDCPDQSGCLVVDQPNAGSAGPGTGDKYGRYQLNGDLDYVDRVKDLIHASVSVYQCADAKGNGIFGCQRIATTFVKSGANQNGEPLRDTGKTLTDDHAGGASPYALMHLDSTPTEWQGEVTINGQQYFADYAPILNPQQQLIGVLSVAVPLDTITTLVTRTTVELVLIGTIIMIAGVILALFFASTIVSTLQRAARQVSGASERIGGIAAQQSSGSAQQVWAINAINQALQNFSDTARDISQRTDQLALMGNQVLQRRAEISPQQIDSILAYMTRSVRDISVASKQQATQYERMTGAMQAVIEIAEQVAGNSQQASESSERLDLVVRQLQRLVGVRPFARVNTSEAMGMDAVGLTDTNVPAASQSARGNVRSVRRGAPPAQGGESGQLAPSGMMSMQGQMGAPMGSMGMMPAGDRRGMNGRAEMPAAGMRGGNPGMPPMRPGGNSMNGGQMRGAGQMGQMNGGGFEMQDWRLPPLPEMPPLPGWDDGQFGQMDQGPSSYNSPSRQGGQSSQGWGMPGENSRPKGPRRGERR
jgi:hypothetical protein